MSRFHKDDNRTRLRYANRLQKELSGFIRRLPALWDYQPRITMYDCGLGTTLSCVHFMRNRHPNRVRICPHTKGCFDFTEPPNRLLYDMRFWAFEITAYSYHQQLFFDDCDSVHRHASAMKTIVLDWKTT